MHSMLNNNAVTMVPHKPRPATSQSLKKSIDSLKGRTSRRVKAKLPCVKVLTAEAVILGQYRNFKIDKVEQ